MRPISILGLFIVLAISACKKEEKALTNTEKVVGELQKEFGAFDAVEYYNDSMGIIYTYRPENNKTKRVKGAIDKAMGFVGEKYIPKYKRTNELIFGSFTLGTPTEKISMRGAHVYADSSSYINIWIETK